MTPMNILLMVLAILFLANTFYNYYKRDLNIGELILWSIIWGALLVISIVPGLISSAGDFLGVEDGLNLIFTLSIVLLFYISFKQYQTILKLQQDVTKLVREISKKK